MILVNADSPCIFIPSGLPWFLDQCKVHDVRMRCEGDRLIADAPPGIITTAFRAILKVHKPALVELLSRTPEDWSRDRAPAATDDPPIVIEHDWRSVVAAQPLDRWLAWRQRSAELQPAIPSADDIREADWLAYWEVVHPAGATA